MGWFSLYVVGDAKYKYIKDGAPNADLYQLLAYVTAFDLPGGLLIYAEGERQCHSFRVRNAGKRLEIAEINLAGDVDELLRRIDQLAERVQSLRRDAGRTGKPLAMA